MDYAHSLASSRKLISPLLRVHTNLRISGRIAMLLLAGDDKQPEDADEEVFQIRVVIHYDCHHPHIWQVPWWRWQKKWQLHQL
jgi:hypothetical protein